MFSDQLQGESLACVNLVTIVEAKAFFAFQTTPLRVQSNSTIHQSQLDASEADEVVQSMAYTGAATLDFLAANAWCIRVSVNLRELV